MLGAIIIVAFTGGSIATSLLFHSNRVPASLKVTWLITGLVALLLALVAAAINLTNEPARRMMTVFADRLASLMPLVSASDILAKTVNGAMLPLAMLILVWGLVSTAGFLAHYRSWKPGEGW